MAVTQRETFTNPVVLGPQQCYFLVICPLRVPVEDPTTNASGQYPEHCPALWPRTCKCCSNAALEMFPPELSSFTVLLQLPLFVNARLPDKLQCRKQIQAVIPE